MISTIRRGAIAALLAGAAMAAATSPSPALAKAAPAPADTAPKVSLSAKLAPLYQAFIKSLDAAKATPAVQAAQAKLKAAQDAGNDAATKAAAADLATALADPKAKLDALTAAAVTPDDKYIAGQAAAIQYGALAADAALQYRGVTMMLDSGKAAPDQIPLLTFYQGQFAYQLGDWPNAIAALRKATAAGYHQNNADVILAESLLSNKQIPEGLAAWKVVLEGALTSGTPAPEGYYGHALQVAYDAQLKPQTLEFGQLLVEAYPKTTSWNSAVTTALSILDFKAPGEELDLLRLMARAGKLSQKSYVSEYIRVADPRALPYEVKTVVDSAAASGLVNPADPAYAPSYQTASGRVAGERAALPGYKRDLTSASANAATLAGDGDSYLAFQMYAEAEPFYQAALTKPGADADMLNTRLGIAQVGAGDYAGAQASFAKVTGASRQPIAALWTIYAKQKAAGK